MFQVLTFVGNQHMNRCASKGCFKMSYDVFWNLLLVHFSKSCMSTVVWRVAWKSELDSCGFLLVKMRFWNCLEELTLSITWTLSLFPWEIRLKCRGGAGERQLPFGEAGRKESERVACDLDLHPTAVSVPVMMKIEQCYYQLDCWQKSEEDAHFFFVKNWHLQNCCASSTCVLLLIWNIIEENMFWIAYIVLNMLGLEKNNVRQV